MGSRVLTACSFRSKSIPQQVFHRCRSAEALRLFRVPAVYLTSAFLWFFSILLFRRINNFRTPDMVSRKSVRFLPPDERPQLNNACEAEYLGTAYLFCSAP